MNFQTGRQHLLGNYKQLRVEWKNFREQWQDSKADEFDKKYMQQLEREMRMTLESLDEIDEIFNSLQKDCF